MGIKYIQFAPCPECSESERPHICHDVVYTGGGDMAFQTFYAMCRTCGYETKRYNHVIELAEAWNADSAKSWPVPSDGK